MATKTSRPRVVSTTDDPTALTAIRLDFAISLPVFARMVNVPAARLTRWEKGADQLDATTARRVARVAKILRGLAGVMQKEFIPTWLTQSSAGCKELDADQPLDLLERGDYKLVEAMIYYIGSGNPG